MKCPHLFAVGVMCYVLFFYAQAQISPPTRKLLPDKPSLFSKLPELFEVSSLFMEKLFAGPDSGTVRIPIGNNFFEGSITEKIQQNPHAVSINIRSSNFDGALLSISRITYGDFSVKYIGRIVSIHYGDVFLIEQQNNTLYFKRQQQSIVITE
jgi:hypothetical protein